MHSIHKKKGGSNHGDGITLTAMHHKPEFIPASNGVSGPVQPVEPESNVYDNNGVSPTA